MVKLALIIGLLWSTVGYAGDKVKCPSVIPVIDLYGNLLDMITPEHEFAMKALKGCQAGRGGVGLPCVDRVIILNNERLTVICGPGEVLKEL